MVATLQKAISGALPVEVLRRYGYARMQIANRDAQRVPGLCQL